MSAFPSGYRVFSTAFGYQKSQPAFEYIQDPNWVWSDDAGNLSTGAWRPLSPSDLVADINITGLNITVGSVALTGNPQVTVSNNPYQMGITGQPIYVTGNINVTNPVLATVNVAITGNPIVSLSGNQNVSLVNAIIPISGVVNTNINSIAITGNPIVTITGNQNSSIVNQILPISGNVLIPTYNKVASSGYVSTFSPLVGQSYVNKVFGYSNVGLTGGVGYIQVFDGVTGSGLFPIATLPVQSGNSWFMDISENGTLFTSGITIINSSDPILNKHYSTGDFFVTIIYR